MSTLSEIESAIERLPAAQIAELAEWLERFRARPGVQLPVEAWLEQTRGAALQAVTTDQVMKLTRGEE
jgi:hypothetical protein